MADQVAEPQENKSKSGMNPERLKQLQKLQDQVRTGGKGTARRKKKVMHHPVVKDDKQLVNTLKKLGANTIPGIEEVNLFRSDNMVIQIKNPKVSTALPCNTFSVSGPAKEVPFTEVVPQIVNTMDPQSLMQLRNLGNLLQRARNAGDAKAAGADDDVPVPEQNFDINA